ncbi:hypothetical protein ACFPRL_25395 [Pseudoclavibacter helvolus]
MAMLARQARTHPSSRHRTTQSPLTPRPPTPTLGSSPAGPRRPATGRVSRSQVRRHSRNTSRTRWCPTFLPLTQRHAHQAPER